MHKPALVPYRYVVFELAISPLCILILHWELARRSTSLDLSQHLLLQRIPVAVKEVEVRNNGECGMKVYNITM